jgi:hypothetical protein
MAVLFASIQRTKSQLSLVAGHRNGSEGRGVWPMAGPQNFIDNLKNLEIVLSVALEHVQENRNQFVRDATADQAQQADTAIREIRTFAQQLNGEFSVLDSVLDYFISRRPPNSNV